MLLSESPHFFAQVQGKDNQFQFSTDDQGHVLVDVFSDSGIGTAEIEQIAGSQPQSITLRFHLDGLEGLTFSYDGINIYLSISSQGANEIMQEITFTDDERSSAHLLRVNEPYWLKTVIRSDDSSLENRIPLTNGEIDVSVPQDYLANDHRTFSIEWIDFYR